MHSPKTDRLVVLTTLCRRMAIADLIRKAPLRSAAMLLAVAVLCSGCGGYNSHPIVVEAEQELSVNQRAADKLGEGVKRASGVTGSSSDADGRAALQFQVAGSRAGGTAVVEGRMFEESWSITSLEVRLDGDERLVLTSDLEKRTGVDTPKFDPTAAPATPTTPAAPPPDVEIALPPGVPGGPPAE
jgi:hypothetical protein